MTSNAESAWVRIALFSEVYWPMVSGVGVTLLRLSDALQARGHAVRVYRPRTPCPRARPTDRGPPLAERAVLSVPDVQWAFPRLREVVDDLAAFGPDVVHVATEFSLGIAGLKAARQLDLPLIASAHTDYDQYAARYGVPWALRAGWHYLRWFYGQAHKVLCPSRIYEESVHRHGVTHTGVWSRGVDPAVFSAAWRSESYRASFGVGPDDLLVTYIGRIAREKNLGMLLEAWETLAPERGAGQLVLAGRPQEEEILGARYRCPGPACSRALPSRGLCLGDVFAFPRPREFALSVDAIGLGPRRGGGRGGFSICRAGRTRWLVEPTACRLVALTPRL